MTPPYRYCFDPVARHCVLHDLVVLAWSRQALQGGVLLGKDSPRLKETLSSLSIPYRSQYDFTLQPLLIYLNTCPSVLASVIKVKDVLSDNLKS